VDALSEALSAVRITGAIFFDLECALPWAFAVPAIQDAAHLLAPATERIFSYHLVTDGEAIVRIEGSDELRVIAGDIVVLPHGSAHTVSGGLPATIVQSEIPVAEVRSGRPRTIRFGGDGDITRIICGFFGCERHADRSFLAGLPPVFSVNLRSDPAGAWLESAVRHWLGEGQSQRPGTALVLSRMAQVLFLETLRRYMDELPAAAVGWLAGARDPLVGAALSLLHRDPAHPWTLAELAAKVGTSRSVLGERFVTFLGEPPLAYLARWRLQLGARLLETTAKTSMEIALEVGYGSESTFNRAFSREFMAPPARYRKQHQGGAAADPIAARVSSLPSSGRRKTPTNRASRAGSRQRGLTPRLRPRPP
jgi:AraC-like DNA-binding protein